MFIRRSDLASTQLSLISIRTLLAVALLSLILAQTVFRSPGMHDWCIGFGIGVLGAALIGSFIERKNKQPSDVQDVRLTR